MQQSQDYRAGLTGGTILSVLPHINGTRILETIILAAVGAIVSFLISRIMRKLFGKS